jgi:hypothetical protein
MQDKVVFSSFFKHPEREVDQVQMLFQYKIYLLKFCGKNHILLYSSDSSDRPMEASDLKFFVALLRHDLLYQCIYGTTS